jgi:U3 small nucleolar RNA-associated protein 20
LPTILLPLHNLTDPSIPTPYSIDPDFLTIYSTLQTTSSELLETINRKVGTEIYTKELVKIREGVKARRRQRGAKRKVEAVSAPEKYGADKRRKGERKKERRKEKGKEFAARRREL